MTTWRCSPEALGPSRPQARRPTGEIERTLPWREPMLPGDHGASTGCPAQSARASKQRAASVARADARKSCVRGFPPVLPSAEPALPIPVQIRAVALEPAFGFLHVGAQRMRKSPEPGRVVHL